MPKKTDHKKYLEYLGLGAEIAVVFCVPMLAGYWADQRYDTFPWLMMGGIVLGILLMAGIFARIFRNLNKPD